MRRESCHIVACRELCEVNRSELLAPTIVSSGFDQTCVVYIKEQPKLASKWTNIASVYHTAIILCRDEVVRSQ